MPVYQLGKMHAHWTNDLLAQEEFVCAALTGQSFASVSSRRGAKVIQSVRGLSKRSVVCSDLTMLQHSSCVSEYVGSFPCKGQT